MKKILLFCTFILGFSLLSEARVLRTDTIVVDTVKFDSELGDDYYDAGIFNIVIQLAMRCAPGLVWLPEILGCGWPPVNTNSCPFCGFHVSLCICFGDCFWCNGRDPCCAICSERCPACCGYDLCCVLCGRFFACSRCGECGSCSCVPTGGGGRPPPQPLPCEGTRCRTCDGFVYLSQGNNCPRCICPPPLPCVGERCPVCRRFKSVSQGDNCLMCNCPPPPPTQQEIDCARLVAIAENQFINNYIDTLIRGRMASSSAPDTFEFGDMIRTVNGVHESFPKRSYPFRARYSLRAGAQYSHGFHSHPRGFHPFPSATDLWTLWRIYNFGSMQNPSEFVWGIITDTSTVILQIEDAARFNNFFYGIFNANNRDSSAARNAFDNFYYQIRRDFIVSDDVNEGHRGRAEFFLYDLGLRQKVSTGPPSSDGSITRRWRIYGRNSSGQVVVIDC